MTLPKLLKNGGKRWISPNNIVISTLGEILANGEISPRTHVEKTIPVTVDK